MFRWVDLPCFEISPTSLFSLEGFLLPVNYGFYLQIPYRRWADNLLKKSSVTHGGFLLQIEVKYLHNRNKNSVNRKGLAAFAVFLLSFFAERCNKSIFGMGCRSPPFNLDFSKNSDWR